MTESAYFEFLDQIDQLDNLLHDTDSQQQGITTDSLDLAETTLRLDEVTP